MSDPLNNLRWSGMLTTENIDKVAERVQRLLGGKPYTFVVFDDGNFDVLHLEAERRGAKKRRLTPKDGVQVQRHLNMATLIIWSADGHSSAVRTSLSEDHYDSTFRNPFIEFQEHQFKVTFQADSGQKIIWAAAVEPESK